MRMHDQSARGIKTYSEVDDDHGGQLGFVSAIKIPSGATFAGGSFEHKFVKDPQPVPSGNTGNVLYAPTTHLPGQCFEVGSAFLPNDTKVQLYLYDFCKGSPGTFLFRGNLVDDIWGPSGNSSFGSLYLTEAKFCAYTNTGYCQTPDVYTVNIIVDGSGNETVGLVESPTAPSPGQTDLLESNGVPFTENVSSATSPKAMDGWSIFETHYYNTSLVPCPQIIDENAGYINWQYYLNGSLLTAPTSYLTNTSASPNNMCTTDTGSTGYYYNVYNAPQTVKDNTWTVVSSPSP